jgi:hypothetical protein
MEEKGLDIGTYMLRWVLEFIEKDHETHENTHKKECLVPIRRFGRVGEIKEPAESVDEDERERDPVHTAEERAKNEDQDKRGNEFDRTHENLHT